jgi:hypothetical protein
MTTFLLRGKGQKPTAPPRYQHDCSACRFIGQVDKYDIWYCPPVSAYKTGPSLIARYGNDGLEYSSGEDFEYRHIMAIRSEIGGLTNDEVILLATFRMMPSLLLNIWKPREN